MPDHLRFLVCVLAVALIGAAVRRLTRPWMTRRADAYVAAMEIRMAREHLYWMAATAVLEADPERWRPSAQKARARLAGTTWLADLERAVSARSRSGGRSSRA